MTPRHIDVNRQGTAFRITVDGIEIPPQAIVRVEKQILPGKRPRLQLTLAAQRITIDDATDSPDKVRFEADQPPGTQPGADDALSAIAVDFDGVIHSYHRGWHDGTIYGDFVPGAEQGLRTLMQHYAVYIHTTRRIEDVAEWLIARGLPCRVGYQGKIWDQPGSLLISNKKLPAVAYIDDRAIRFQDWDQVTSAALSMTRKKQRKHKKSNLENRDI